MWRELTCYLYRHEGQITIAKAESEKNRDNIKELIETLKNIEHNDND